MDMCIFADTNMQVRKHGRASYTQLSVQAAIAKADPSTDDLGALPDL